MSTSSTPVFTGTSTYSSDFTQVITRAQQIASLPITLLDAQQSTLTSQQSAVSTLGDSFNTLQTALQSLASAASSPNTAVSYSNATVASATAGTGVLLGSYTLDVVDPGSQATAASLTGVADPTQSSISTANSFRLIANGQEFDGIQPASNTLNSLAAAINTAAQGAVQATIVNVGSQATPSYELSLQNTSYGALPITLDDGQGGANLMAAPSTATSVEYRVNGQPATGDPLTSNSRTLTLSPNLTATVLTAGTTTITVAQSTANLGAQLSAFVNAYNSASQALSAQTGSSGGALVGDSLVSTLSQTLRSIVNFTGTGSGSIQSLADLGVTFNQTFQLSFDSTAFSQAMAQDPAGAAAFLGGATTGGFLEAATNSLTGITDSTSGLIPSTLQSYSSELADITNKVTDDQARVDQLTQNLTAQMSAADALIASMQQQAIYFTNMFDAMSTDQSSMK